MIVRVLGDIVVVVPNVAAADEDRFMKANPTGGFMKVGSLPKSRHGQFKMVNGEIVVDEDREAECEAKRKQAEFKHERAAQYPSISEQLDMMYWDRINGTDTWLETISKAKKSVSKPKT